MNSKPLISVLIPMYNSALFVEQAIGSIMVQTYKNFELIILDDASNDGSYELVRKLSQKDKRIKLLRSKKNLGIAGSINRLLKEVKGDYIARMDADDIAFPQRLEKEVNYLLKNPKVGIVGSFMIEINEDNEPISVREAPLAHNEISKHFMTMQAIQNPSMMMNKRLIPARQFWHKTNLSPVDDLDFYLRVINKVQFANIPEYLMAYRKHSSNSSLKNIRKTFSLSLKVRIKALFKYGYKTTLDQLIVCAVQTIGVFIIPNKLLYPVYKLWKGNKERKAKAALSSTISFIHRKPILALSKA